jgi:anti-sigma28 factor (negative regulator of flagellin synthesis)
VRAIREQIEDGTYEVDAKDVARAILQKDGAYILRSQDQRDK